MFFGHLGVGKKPKEKRVNLCKLVTFKWRNGQRVLKSNRPEITVRILQVNAEWKSLRFFCGSYKTFPYRELGGSAVTRNTIW